MAHHDEGHLLVDSRLEWNPLRLPQLFQGSGGDGFALVGIGLGAAVAGEVLQAGGHAIPLQALHHGPHQRRRHVGVIAVGPAADFCIIGVGDHIGHRGKIQIEAQLPQLLGHGLAHVVDLGQIGPLSIVGGGFKIGGPHGLIGAYPGDQAALLIHRQKQGRFGIGLSPGQHGLGLRPVHQVQGKIAQASHRTGLQRRLGGVPCLGDGAGVRQALRRHKEQLPELFLRGHGLQIGPGLFGVGVRFLHRLLRLLRRLLRDFFRRLLRRRFRLFGRLRLLRQSAIGLLLLGLEQLLRAQHCRLRPLPGQSAPQEKARESHQRQAERDDNHRTKNFQYFHSCLQTKSAGRLRGALHGCPSSVSGSSAGCSSAGCSSAGRPSGVSGSGSQAGYCSMFQ